MLQNPKREEQWGKEKEEETEKRKQGTGGKGRAQGKDVPEH